MSGDATEAAGRARAERDLGILLNRISSMGGSLSGCIVGMDSVHVIWDDEASS